MPTLNATAAAAFSVYIDVDDNQYTMNVDGLIKIQIRMLPFSKPNYIFSLASLKSYIHSKKTSKKLFFVVSKIIFNVALCFFYVETHSFEDSVSAK